MKLPYFEGTVFLVPLRNGGYARGVVARVRPRGKIVLGYFFGPRLESTTAAALEDLEPSRAILRVRFGDLGLINGEWPILGKVPNWNRIEWPVPDFVWHDPLGKLKSRRVRYADDDPSCRVQEFVIENGSGLTPDSLFGYGAVEIKLTEILA